jgi:hypothetical protein
VALRAEAEHGEGFVFQHAEIGVFVGIDFCHKFFKRVKSLATRRNPVNLQNQEKPGEKFSGNRP